MKQSNHFRLLKLRKILFEETDEEHELDIYEIEKKLKRAMDVDRIDHRTLKNDLLALEEMGMEIVRNRRKHGKIFYSHQNKLFETYQIRMLSDAILSARFITPKEKEQLLEKLKQLTSIHIRKTLPHPVLFSQTINLDYELIKLNIDILHKAITEKKVVCYQYGDFNAEKQFVFRRDGDLYFVEPYALIWQNDLYYLVAKFIETDEFRHYRLDRMRNIEITDEVFKREKTFSLQPYIDNTFHMYSGEAVVMEIVFHMSLLNAIFDRFGMDVTIETVDEEHFLLRTKASLSDGLVSWILKWGKRARVLSPERLVKRIKDEVDGMTSHYDTM